MDGEIFIMPGYDNDNKRRLISDDNVYILALDGDTDFQPKAVILLVDRSELDKRILSRPCRTHSNFPHKLNDTAGKSYHK